jgi:hypothetical protein
VRKYTQRITSPTSDGGAKITSPEAKTLVKVMDTVMNVGRRSLSADDFNTLRILVGYGVQADVMGPPGRREAQFVHQVDFLSVWMAAYRVIDTFK